MKLFGRKHLFKSVPTALIILCISATLMLLAIAKVEKKDMLEVEQQMSPQPSKKKGLSYSETVREGVVKEVWCGSRHLRITSKESALFFFQEGKSIEAVEQLGDVVCFMQEKLFFENGGPMQEVRYLQAKKACYNYNTQLFVAEDVFISKFHFKGHVLPKTVEEATPLMQGTAESVEFTLKGEKIDFHAHHFKATFDSKTRKL